MSCSFLCIMLRRLEGAFEDGAGYGAVDVAVFAEEGATLVEAAFDFGYGFFANVEL